MRTEQTRLASPQGVFSRLTTFLFPGSLLCPGSPHSPSQAQHTPIPRLTALPARQPPPVHADPVEPAEGRIRLHALALGAGVLLRAPAGHTRLVVGLGGDHAMALCQGPSQSKEKNLGLLPRKNSTQSQTIPPAPGKPQLQIVLIGNTPTQLNEV